MHYHVAVLLLSAGVLLAAALLDIRGGQQVLLPIGSLSIPELCTWRRLTGWSCPGCGLTRSFIALVRFDVRQAWSYNPAGVLLFGLILAQFPYRMAQLWRLSTSRPAWHPKGGTIVVWVLAACLLLQWLWRVVNPW